MSDTQYIQCLNNLIDKYNLKLQLDEFGTEVYYESKLIGRWKKLSNRIMFTHIIKYGNYGGGYDIDYYNWDDMCKGIEERIEQLKG